ncbi:MAG: glutathione S-transferase family protein [Rhizobiaceae bacterium]
MYQIVGSPRSRLTRVSWALQELAEPYEIVTLKPHTPEITKYNPAGKGPILVDGKIVVIDSAAIVTYLSDKHIEKGLGAAPASAERALMDSWIHFAQNDLEAPLWLKLRHTFLLPEEMRADVSKITRYDFAVAIKAMDIRLGANEYAIGDRFTVADIILGHCGYWARSAKFSIESDTVNAYFDRILSRDGLKRARELEKDL